MGEKRRTGSKEAKSSMKLIISGSRGFDDYELLCKKAEQVNENVDEITEVVCGGAKGADMLGKKWADENSIPVKLMPANWAKHGKAAGPIRNREMAEYADALLVFWDGESPGTKNMITTMMELKKPYHLVSCEDLL
jgi:hypothetical protein